jgi:hypothetical protein
MVPTSKPCRDETRIKVLVRADTWRRRIESGKARDLAEQEEVRVAYVYRLLPLGLRLAEILGMGRSLGADGEAPEVALGRANDLNQGAPALSAIAAASGLPFDQARQAGPLVGQGQTTSKSITTKVPQITTNIPTINATIATYIDTRYEYL